MCQIITIEFQDVTLELLITGKQNLCELTYLACMSTPKV